MNILYIGDIMGQPGIDVATEFLPSLRQKHEVNIVIAQAENVTGGKGMSNEDMNKLKALGIDCFTGGNWSLFRETVLSDPRVVRPANYPEGIPGVGFRYIDSYMGSILVISLLGKIVGKDADNPLKNPLQTIDEILEAESSTKRFATIVNFHGDYSSEKRIIGYYLDGRVTAVIGDHWHVPTADAMVLPKGTAHITDVGMCGSLHSSLGLSFDSVVPRWLDGRQTRNVIETKKPYQFNAVLVNVNEKTGTARSIEHIQRLLT